jgi:chemotaxis protein methyltransferase CheR
MSSSTSSFKYIQEFLLNRVAIVLQEDKQYLIDSRLRPVVSKYGFTDLDDLVTHLRQSADDNLHTDLIDAMTTNETYFFRDPNLFEIMTKNVLPTLLEARQKKRRLQIWSAACSTGQEPYSVAMEIRENMADFANVDLHLLATDVSSASLVRATAGTYRKFEVNRGLSMKYLQRYFTLQGIDYHLNNEVREMVDFRYINLIGKWPFDLAPDLVMLRNVLIYFDVDVKKRILQRVREVMAPDGYLMLGSAETTLNLDVNFKRVFPGIYRLNDAGQRA